MSAHEAAAMMDDVRDIGFSDFEPLSSSGRNTDNVLFNGNLFRDDSPVKIARALNALSPEENRKVLEVTELLDTRKCLTLEELRTILGVGLASKLVGVGMYDLSRVSNKDEQATYVTKPSSFAKFGAPSHVEDAFDLAKALVASLTYGMTRSRYGRGRITMLESLLRKLLRGYEVGPATAIGEDYTYLETKRVVRVRRSGDRYWMKLLKRDIGQLAYDVLVIGDGGASTMASTAIPESPVSRFSGPEAGRTRVRRNQRKERSRSQLVPILDSLRVGEL